MPYDCANNKLWTAVGIGLNAKPLFCEILALSVASVVSRMKPLALSPDIRVLSSKAQEPLPLKPSRIAEPPVSAVTESESYHNHESDIPSSAWWVCQCKCHPCLIVAAICRWGANVINKCTAHAKQGFTISTAAGIKKQKLGLGNGFQTKKKARALGKMSISIG